MNRMRQDALLRKVDEHRPQLESLAYDSTSSSAERRRAVGLLAWARCGNQSMVCRVSGRARSTQQRSLARFELDGVAGLANKSTNRHRRPTGELAAVLARLPELAALTPQDFGWQRPTWTRELFCAQLLAELNVVMSPEHVGRLLRRVGCRLVRPKPAIRLAPADKDAQLATLAATIAALPADEPVVYEDECDIHLNPKSGPDWTPAGKRKVLMTPGQNEKRYLAGALNKKTNEIVIISSNRKSSNLFIALVQELMLRYADAPKVHVVLDNYIIHKSKKSLAAVAAYGERLQCHFLPPYCPEGNAIERLWLDVHANVTRNHRHTEVDMVLDDALNYIDARDGRGSRAVAKLRAIPAELRFGAI